MGNGDDQILEQGPKSTGNVLKDSSKTDVKAENDNKGSTMDAKDELARPNLQVSGEKKILSMAEKMGLPSGNASLTEPTPKVQVSTQQIVLEPISSKLARTVDLEAEKKRAHRLGFGKSAVLKAVEGNKKIGVKSADKPNKSPLLSGDDSLGEAEKRKLRAEKFGLGTNAEKNESNAPKIAPAVDILSEEKRKARLARFGEVSVPVKDQSAVSLPTAATQTAEKQTAVVAVLNSEERRKARLERFGAEALEKKTAVQKSPAAEKKSGDETLSAADVNSEAKKRARLEKFAADTAKNGSAKPAESKAGDSSNLDETALEEILKKAKRAERFGLSLSDADESALKKKQRAEKFAPLAVNPSAV